MVFYPKIQISPHFVPKIVSTLFPPSATLIREMGLKTVAKSMAIEAGLPLVPGSDGAINDAEAAKVYAEKIGYPVLLKASTGGGGRGMRIVEKPETIERHFKSASDEALAAFDNGDMFIENFRTQSILSFRFWVINMAM